jgi:hypothetical protein
LEPHQNIQEKLFLALRDFHEPEWLAGKIFRGDYSKTVWRQEGKPVTIQMESPMPNLTKVTKAKRF